MKRSYLLFVIGLVSFGIGLGLFLSKFQTNLTNPTSLIGVCGLEGCHGLEVSCGTKVAEMCDEMYMIGDGCRQFVHCSKSNGVCKMVENIKFDRCKSCVQECIDSFGDDPIALSDCENVCITKEQGGDE